MLEILQYVTSGFWVFVGSTIFVCYSIAAVGWSIAQVVSAYKK